MNGSCTLNQNEIRIKAVKWRLVLSCVWLFTTPWTVAHQASLFMEFSRQEYQSGLPFPFPGDLPDPGIKPMSPTLQADSLLTEPPGKPQAVKRALKTVKHVNYSVTTITSADDKMSWFILLTFCYCPVNSKSRPLLSGGAETSWHLLYSLLINSIWSESRKKLMPWIDGHILYSSSLNTDCSYRDVFTHLQWKETLTIRES